ncbi:MAG TPA: nicotinate (nicotinamide) nucleotide adenylyltransferase [bacterium]|nr:nicotinate (nicotinamide) nucleotide adenylyltransferase [bacterium]
MARPLDPPRDGSPPRGSAPRGLGVLGGAFNPPHRTHVRLAEQALRQLPIAELRVIPSGDHPHKRGRDMAPAEDRLAMARIAFADLSGVVVDDRELRRAGPSFTVDTLAELHAEAPETKLWFLIGSDNLPLLPTWHEHHRLLALATVVTWPRRGHPIEPAALATLDLSDAERRSLLANVLDLPADDVAASDLRQRWRRGERDLPELPPGVAAYLEARALYR